MSQEFTQTELKLIDIIGAENVVKKINEKIILSQLKQVCNQAGGGSWESFKGKTLEELLPIFAANGIGFAWHKPSNAESLCKDDLHFL